MSKGLFLVSAVLLALCGISSALECYHCYINDQNLDYGVIGSEFVPCDAKNISASNTWVCPHVNSKCVYQQVKILSTNMIQTSRTCSNGLMDPCDPNNLLPGMKMVKCSTCTTDRCNLEDKEEEKEFTFNINANVNLYIRQ